MKSVSILTLITIIVACSENNGFKGDVATGSAKPPESKNSAPLPEVEEDSTSTPAPAPAPTPAVPFQEACDSASVKEVIETISFAARAPGCGAFKNSAGQDIKNDGTVTVIETTTANLKLPAGTLCAMSLETKETTQMRYDDMMVFAIDANVVFTSTKNIDPLLEEKSGVLIWDQNRLLNKRLDFEGEASCIGGKDTCTIPPTDKAGPFAVSVPSAKFEPISNSITGKAEVPVTLSVTGDNDGTDCSHSAVDMNVTIKYLP